MKEPESCSFLLPQRPLCRLFPLPECPAPTREDIYLSSTGYLPFFGSTSLISSGEASTPLLVSMDVMLILLQFLGWP